MKEEAANHYRTEGIILKRQPYRESSLLCRCLTKDYGIISIIASGVQKEKSPLTGAFEPFSQLQMELYRTPKTDIFNLRSASLIKVHLNGLKYRESLLIHAAGELLLQNDIIAGESEHYYQLLVDYLNYLPETDYHPFHVFMRFVYRYMDFLGISLQMECIRCRKIDFRYYFPQEDGFLCDKCYLPALSDNLLELQTESVTILMNIYNLKDIQSIMFDKQTVDEISKVILIHLANHFNKKFHLNSLKDYK